MAYDKQDLFKRAISAVEENELCLMADVISFLPCCTSIFYDYFPSGSEESEHLKGLMEKHRIKEKREARKRWKKSGNATLELAYYRLLATDEERKKLATNYMEVAGPDGEPIPHTHKVEKHEVIFRDFSEKDADV